jgi:hypothetical protein
MLIEASITFMLVVDLDANEFEFVIKVIGSGTW